METTEKTSIKSGAAILLISAIMLLFLIPPVAQFSGISINILQAGLAGAAIVLSIVAMVTYKTYQTTHAFCFMAFWCLVAACFMWLEISPIFLVIWTLLGGLAAMLDDVNAIIFIITSIAFTAASYWLNGRSYISDYFGIAIGGILAPIIGSNINQRIKPTKTEELMMNKASAEFALRSETVVDSISDGVIVIDERGNILLINPSAISLIGWGREDAIGLNVQSVLSLTDSDNNLLEGNDNPIIASLQKKTPLESKDYKIQTKFSGKFIPIMLSINVSTDDDGGSIIINIRDIEHDKAEGREQMEFISTASHEMRTPIASIEGYLGLALNPNTATIDERAKQYLDKAHEASKHLGRLFADLLDVTKLDDKHVQARPEPVDVTSFVRESVEAFIPDIRAKGISYVFRPDMAKTGEKTINPVYYANTDTRFLKEAINNLIENAIKYNKPNGSIEANVTSRGNNVVVSIADTGMGVPPEDINHIFQKFYRVDNSDTREIGGTGLGLFISKQRIESVNGKMWVESEYQKGSTFYISIPRISNNEYGMLKSEFESRAREKEQLENRGKETDHLNIPPTPVQPSNSSYRPADQLEQTFAKSPGLPNIDDSGLKTQPTLTGQYMATESKSNGLDQDSETRATGGSSYVVHSASPITDQIPPQANVSSQENPQPISTSQPQPSTPTPVQTDAQSAQAKKIPSLEQIEQHKEEYLNYLRQQQKGAQ